jgi:large conductance mechanosensitive channel
MIEEFKTFILRGNAVDLAVGVIIGAAFGSIVQSLVGDVFMPVVGALTGGLDFSNHFIALSSKVTADTLVEAKKQGAVLAWGNFLTISINFVVVGFILFLLIRAINTLLRRKPAQPPPLTAQEQLLTEIRDLLKSR